MSTISDAIVTARRRVYAQSILTTLGWLALCDLGLITILAGVDVLLAIAVPLWVYGAVAVLAVALAPVLAWSSRPSLAQAATLIDERLHLKDQLATALYAESMTGDSFAGYVVAEAQRSASTISVAEAFPVRLQRVWGYVPVIGVLVMVLCVFLAHSQPDPFGLRLAKQNRQDDSASTDQAEHHIVKARALIHDLNTEESLVTKEIDPLRLLNELASLSRHDLNNLQGKRDAVVKLSDIQEKLAVATDTKQREVQAMHNAMSRLDTEQDGPADRFADALRRSDYQAAAAELGELVGRIKQMSDQQKIALRQQFQNLQNQLQQLAQQQIQQDQQIQQQIQQQLQQAGLNQQQIQQLQQEGYDSPQFAQQALQSQGISSQKAQQMVHQIQQQQQQCRGCQNQAQNQASLGQSLQQMSQSLVQQQGSQDPQRFRQGAWSAQQALNQMVQMQSQLQQMQQAQSTLGTAMQNLHHPGDFGREVGSGEGGHPLGRERPLGTHTYQQRADIQDHKGRVIASWFKDGQMVAGAPTVQFDRAITDARDNAERAVADNRVPRRYHESVREYFKQLPDSPDRIGRAPAAPR